MSEANSKTPFLDACAKAELDREIIDMRMRRLLEKQGWEYTCKTPGAHWLYQKTLPDGRTVLVSQLIAIRIEQDLCGEEYEESD